MTERTFALACLKRRLARAAETAKALFQIAMTKLMSRRIARYRDFSPGVAVPGAPDAAAARS